jgi:zinc/manganese transport system permease protein
VEVVDLWRWPLLAVVLLPGLLVYLGLHIVERGVIFVDLALAQVAALGVAVAILMGSDPAHDRLPYLMSLLFTFIGAAIFALTRFRHVRVPQEAIIGIVYIVSASAAVLVLSYTPSGDEDIKNLLVGNILLVTREQVLQTFALFAVIAAVHGAFRRKFTQLSFDLEGAIAQGMRTRLWDFLFYVTFGFAVTSFVQIAGVYLVFSYLIVPIGVRGTALPAHRLATRDRLDGRLRSRGVRAPDVHAVAVDGPSHGPDDRLPVRIPARAQRRAGVGAEAPNRELIPAHARLDAGVELLVHARLEVRAGDEEQEEHRFRQQVGEALGRIAFADVALLREQWQHLVDREIAAAREAQRRERGMSGVVSNTVSAAPRSASPAPCVVGGREDVAERGVERREHARGLAVAARAQHAKLVEPAHALHQQALGRETRARSACRRSARR